MAEDNTPDNVEKGNPSVNTNYQVSSQTPAPLVVNPGDEHIIVYITKTGGSYHKSSCIHLRRSKIEVTLKDAKEQEKQACKVCHPPK